MSTDGRGDRHVVLVGMMGSGKTTVGRLLADRLGRPLWDSDELIESRAGRSVREIFETDGEAAFRDLEADALVEAISDERPAVVAAAGGVVLRPGNRIALRDAIVVWLTAETHVLAGRVRSGDHRPQLGDDPQRRLDELLPERLPLYAEVADLVVDTAALAPDAVADRIVELLDG